MNIKDTVDDVFENYNVCSQNEDSIKAELVCELEDTFRSEVKDVLDELEWQLSFGNDVLSQAETLELIRQKLC